MPVRLGWWEEQEPMVKASKSSRKSSKNSKKRNKKKLMGQEPSLVKEIVSEENK